MLKTGGPAEAHLSPQSLAPPTTRLGAVYLSPQIASHFIFLSLSGLSWDVEVVYLAL